MPRPLLLCLAVVAFCAVGTSAHGIHGVGGEVGTESPYWLAFVLNIGAAACTMVGAALVICSPSLRAKLDDELSPMLVIFLSFSGGILLWVALVVLQPEGQKILYDARQGAPNAISSAFFFGGWALGVVLQRHAHAQKRRAIAAGGRREAAVGAEGDDAPAPAPAPTGAASSEDAQATAASRFRDESKSELMALGLHTALSLGLHNFAEGFVSFVVVLVDRKIGAATAVAIMLHNIPEGFVIAAPAMAATNSWRKPFMLSLLATLSEVFAGLLVWVLLQVITLDSNSMELAWMQASLSSLAAGIMAQTTLGSLVPQCLSRERQRQLALLRAAPATKEQLERGLEGGGAVPEPAPAVDANTKTDNSLVINCLLLGMFCMAIVLACFDLEEHRKQLCYNATGSLYL